jgi:hypothetical protein
MNDIIKHLEVAALKLAAEKFRTPHLDAAAHFIAEAANLLGLHSKISLETPPSDDSAPETSPTARKS